MSWLIACSELRRERVPFEEEGANDAPLPFFSVLVHLPNTSSSHSAVGDRDKQASGIRGVISEPQFEKQNVSEHRSSRHKGREA